MKKTRKWLIKKIKKTKLYQELRKDIIDGANFKWNEFYDKADVYNRFVKNVSTESHEIKRLLEGKMTIASDVHFNSNSIIMVASSIGDGQVRFIDANFDSLKHFRDTVKYLQNTFQVPEERMFIDTPMRNKGWL